MILFYLFLLLVVCLVISFVNNSIDKTYWSKWTNKNFPFKWHGKTLWYSRSCAVSLYTFCKDKEGSWCVLANKRGSGTPDFQGYWNCPCGYLDYNESGEEAAIRETKEETGIKIPLTSVIFKGVSTQPTENRQNVSLRYTAILEGVTTDYSFNTKDMEENEVGDVQWIPISKIGDYKWAFNHEKNIENLAKLMLI